MSTPVGSAREQLIEMVRRGVTYPGTKRVPAKSGTQHRESAVLVLFGVLDQIPGKTNGVSAVHADLDVLLTRRSDTMRYHPGQIAFPGGGREPADASPAEAALREAEEETGLDPAGVEIVGELPPFEVAVSNNLVTPVIGWWRSPSDVVADNTESLEVFRVPVSELVNPLNRGTSVLPYTTPNSSLVREFRADAFKLGPQFSNRVVWGFTGIVLSTLFDALGWAAPWDSSREFTLPTRTSESSRPGRSSE